MSPGFDADDLPEIEESDNNMHVGLMTRFRRKKVVIEMVIDSEKFDDPHEWPWPAILGFTSTLRYDRARIVSVESEDMGSMLS